MYRDEGGVDDVTARDSAELVQVRDGPRFAEAVHAQRDLWDPEGRAEPGEAVAGGVVHAYDRAASLGGGYFLSYRCTASRHPEPGCDLHDRHPVVQDLENCVALLHDTELHQHDATPRSRTRPGSTARQPATRNTTTGATVAHVPEPVSPRYRDRAGRCRTTTGAATSSIYRGRTLLGVGLNEPRETAM